MGPQQAEILGRVGGRSELHPSLEPARRPSHILLARLSGHVWSPGPWSACATAALLQFSLDAPYSPLLLRAANLGLVSLVFQDGQFRVAAPHEHPA